MRPSRPCRPAPVGLLVSLLVLLGGCRPAAGEPYPPETPAEPDTAEPAEPDAPSTSGRCGPEDTALDELSWVPRDARLVALVEPEQLDDAGARLRALVDDPTLSPPLPVLARLELDQLPLQAQLLWITLDQGGFEPATVLRLQGPDGLSAWVFRAPCDVNTTAARAGAAWKVLFRAAVDARIGRPFPNSPFPYDVLMLAGDRVALVPRDGAEAHRAWLTRPTPDPVGAGPLPPGPGELLLTLEPATVRAVLRGPSLLSPGDGATTDTTRALRATAKAAEIVQLTGTDAGSGD